MTFKKFAQLGIVLLSLSTQPAFAKDKNKFDIDRFRQQVKNNEVVYNTSSGHQVREMETSVGYIQKEYDTAGNSILQREFNKEGKLIKEGRLAKVAKQEMPIGEWKIFDGKGKVSEIKNFEEGFQITYNEILDICKKRNINLADRLSTLTKSKPGERPTWVIGWNSLPPRSEKASENDRSPTTRMEVIVVDGVSGDIKESSPYVPFKVAH